MAKLFDRLFGRAKKEEEPYQPMPVAAPEYDPEYVAYCIELEQIVSALEENLHTSDDPKEIAMQTLKVACSFYGGDWAGILEVDLDLDVWNPLWWFNMSKRDRTEHLFGEFELAKFAVSPAVRKNGIGESLMRAAFDKAREVGARRLYLESNTRCESAIRMYRRLGFREIEVQHSEFERCNIQMEFAIGQSLRS